MFRDRQQELERIQQQLLEEDDLPEDDDSMPDDDYDPADEPPDRSEPYDFYNTDGTDLDPEELSDELLPPRKKSMTGLLIATLLLTAVILALVAWWMVRMRG
jgi:hypothetical protein